MIAIFSVIAFLVIVVALWYIFGPKETPTDVVIEIPSFDIPVVIPEEKLAEIPVHKIVRAKIRKHVVKKKSAKK